MRRRGVIYQILGNSSLHIGQDVAAKIAIGGVHVLRGSYSNSALYYAETENNFNLKIILLSPSFIWSHPTK